MLHRTEPDDSQPSLAGNPLVASVLRENVCVADGRATIGLWGGWHALLAEIPAFGKVLAIGRNSHAVIGTMTGNARDCAERTAALLSKAGLPVRLHDLAQYDPRSMLEETTLLLPKPALKARFIQKSFSPIVPPCRSRLRKSCSNRRTRYVGLKATPV